MDVSQLKTQYLSEINNLLNQLIVNPEKFAATLYSETLTGPFWNREKTLYSPYLPINSPSICCQAQDFCLIKKQIPLQKGKEGQTYRIFVDSQNEYVLKVDFKVNPEIKYVKSPPQKYSIQKYKGTNLVQDCLYPNFENLTFLELDNFTNEYLIGFLLTELYRQKPQLKGVIEFYTATLCKSGNYQGNILLEYAQYGDLVNFSRNPNFTEIRSFLFSDKNPDTLLTLKSNIIVDVIKQIAANLDFLHETVQFNHGDMKSRNILITNQPSQGNYKNIIWKSNFTAKLADFGKSSLTVQTQIGPVRLFESKNLAKIYFVKGFQPVMGRINTTPYFVVNNINNITAYADIRHMGSPYYYSFDTYTFLTSLYLIPEIFYPVMSDPEMRKLLWDDLWFSQDLDLVNSRLYPAVGKSKFDSYGKVVEILRGLKLKCQAHQILMTNLTKLT